MDEISDNKKKIYNKFEEDFFYILDQNNLEELPFISSEIFFEYDRIFLDSDVFEKIKKDDIRFKIFITDKEKETKNKLSYVTYSFEDYEITFNIDLIYIHSQNLKLDFFQTFLLIIEHEFVHFIVWLWDYTEDKKDDIIFRNHGEFFNCVAETLFGHKNISHDLGYKNQMCDNSYLTNLSPSFSKMLSSAHIQKDIFEDYINSEIYKKQERAFQRLKINDYEGVCIIGVPENNSHIIISKICKKFNLKCIVFIAIEDEDSYSILQIKKDAIIEKIENVPKNYEEKVEMLEKIAEKNASDKILYIPIGMYDKVFKKDFVADTEYRYVDVLLDSKLQYGSKIRGAKFFYDIKQEGYDEIVLAGSAEGYAQVTGPYCCNEVGLKCTIFIKKLPQRSDATRKGLALNANIIEISDKEKYHKMRDLDKMAYVYSKKKPRVKYVQIGLHDKGFIDAVTNNVICLKEKYNIKPTELWIVAGTGTIAAGISQAFPNVPVNLVKVGLDLWKESLEYIEKSSFHKPNIYVAPVKFHEKSPEKSPYEAHANYDDKVWYFAKRYAKDGALIWIIA